MPGLEAKIFSIPMTVRFHDLDALGHVNNAVYLTYIEAARLAYFAHLKITDPVQPSLMLARVEADYFRPVLMQHDVRVTASISRIGNKSLNMQHDIIADGVMAAKLETVLVWYDHEAQTSVVVPDEVRRTILTWEQSD
jgi:acyl-CoA thioester hydrolase